MSASDRCLPLVVTSVLVLLTLAGCRPEPGAPGASDAALNGAATGSVAEPAAGAPAGGADVALEPSAAALLAGLAPDRLVDLSHPFGADTIYWPTASGFELTVDFAGASPGGWWYASNSIAGSEHGGTHMDAPFHFAESGVTVDELPVDALIAEVVVIDVRAAGAVDPDHAVSAGEIRAFESAHGDIPAGSVVLLHTGWSERWPDVKAYLGDDTPGATDDLHFPGFGPDAAAYLVARGVAGVGLDTASLDPGNVADFAAHQVFGGGNVYGLENLTNLDRLPPRGAALIALPMKITGGTGGPLRAVAVLP